MRFYNKVLKTINKRYLSLTSERVEDPMSLSIAKINSMNNYATPFKKMVKHIKGIEPILSHQGEDIKNGTKFWDPKNLVASNRETADSVEAITIVQQPGSLSLFNPVNTVSLQGMSENIPLFNCSEDQVNFHQKFTAEKGAEKTPTKMRSTLKRDTSDCSIKKLILLSAQVDDIGFHTELGRARYKYADFMYCADLGKYPNTLLITLRRFAYPVGDDIFKYAGSNKEANPEAQGFDVARMVTWFGNEDNKIENILAYNFNASWKEQTGERVGIENTQSSKDTTPLNQLANTLSKDYLTRQARGHTNVNDLLSEWGKDSESITIQNLAKADSGETLQQFIKQKYQDDTNKVFEPLNTVRTNHKYEGQLTFTHNISLKFKYKLRAYDNINPKAAFLDLLANTLVCTYRRGKFWGGSRPIFGPLSNQNVFNIAHAFIDGNIDSLGGFFSAVVSGSFDLSSISSQLGDLLGTVKNVWSTGANGLLNEVGNTLGIKDLSLNTFTDGDTDKVKQAAGSMVNMLAVGLKALIKNLYGRPEMYAVNALVTGQDTGFWHLTIGNPRNPIAAIGNLMLTDTKITLCGALGIDDFPSELIVEVSLSPARPRDQVDIERMYTKGTESIYLNIVDSFKDIQIEKKKFDVEEPKQRDVSEYNDMFIGHSDVWVENEIKNITGLDIRYGEQALDGTTKQFEDSNKNFTAVLCSDAKKLLTYAEHEDKGAEELLKMMESSIKNSSVKLWNDWSDRYSAYYSGEEDVNAEGKKRSDPTKWSGFNTAYNEWTNIKKKSDGNQWINGTGNSIVQSFSINADSILWNTLSGQLKAEYDLELEKWKSKRDEWLTENKVDQHFTSSMNENKVDQYFTSSMKKNIFGTLDNQMIYNISEEMR